MKEKGRKNYELAQAASRAAWQMCLLTVILGIIYICFSALINYSEDIFGENLL